jgi:hypothetical protein
MLSFGMLHRVALVRTDVSEELNVSIIRVTKIAEPGKTLAVTSNQRRLRRNISVRQLLVTANVVPSSPILVTLMMEALSSSETSALTEPHGVTSQKTTFFGGGWIYRGPHIAQYAEAIVSLPGSCEPERPVRPIRLEAGRPPGHQVRFEHNDRKEWYH